MKIGDLAKATGASVEAVRYYEREGLLPQAPRSDGNYRMYTTEHVERLAFVRHCRSLDMALDEIRLLLRFKDAPGEECGEVNALLDEHIGHVATRIRELRQLEKQLKTLRNQCVGVQDSARCGILNQLTHEAATADAPVADRMNHVDTAHGRLVRKSGT